MGNGLRAHSINFLPFAFFFFVHFRDLIHGGGGGGGGVNLRMLGQLGPRLCQVSRCVAMGVRLGTPAWARLRGGG